MTQLIKLYMHILFLNKSKRFKLLILIKAVKTNEHIKTQNFFLYKIKIFNQI